MKKRFIFLLMAALSFCTSVSAEAASGGYGTAGYYYYTDIVTYLWGVPVNAINIGGETLIDAESMSHYGFEVNWRPDERRLELIDNGGHVTDEKAQSGALLDKANGKPGGIAGKYYDTDIVATLNGKVIKSRNLGSRTFISAEGMRDFGYAVDWDASTRTLLITTPRDYSPAICDPWSLMIFSSLDDGADDQLESLYFTAKRNWYTGERYDIGGSGYTKLSNIILARDGSGRISLSFSVYQYVGLDETEYIRSRLGEVICYKYGEYIREPASVYGALNDLVRVYINGDPVKISELRYSQGNGHADYTLVLDTDGSLEARGVFSISMLCNVPEGADIAIPASTAGQTPYELALQEIRGLWNYTSLWEAETDAVKIIYGVQTGTPHGSAYTLFLISETDGTITNLLPKTGLASIWGIHPSLYALSVSGDGKLLYFSCDSGGTIHRFQTDLETTAICEIG